MLGSVEDSLRLADRALADAKSAAHAPTMVNVLRFAALLGLFRCNPEAVVTYSQALADIASRYDLHAHWAGYAVFFQGWAKWSDDVGEPRFAEMQRGLAIAREQSGNWLSSSSEAALADVVSRYNFPAYWAGIAVFLQGWGMSRLAEMRRGLAIYREQGRIWLLPEAVLAEAEASAGETDAGLRRLDDAVAAMERTAP